MTTSEKPVRVAIVDLYNGIRNEGMRAIRELVAAATPEAALEPIPEPTPTAEPVQVVDLVHLRHGRHDSVATEEPAETGSIARSARQSVSRHQATAKIGIADH